MFDNLTHTISFTFFQNAAIIYYYYTENGGGDMFVYLYASYNHFIKIFLYKIINSHIKSPLCDGYYFHLRESSSVLCTRTSTCYLGFRLNAHTICVCCMYATVYPVYDRIHSMFISALLSKLNCESIKWIQFPIQSRIYFFFPHLEMESAYFPLLSSFGR